MDEAEERHQIAVADWEASVKTHDLNEAWNRYVEERGGPTFLQALSNPNPPGNHGINASIRLRRWERHLYDWWFKSLPNAVRESWKRYVEELVRSGLITPEEAQLPQWREVPGWSRIVPTV